MPLKDSIYSLKPRETSGSLSGSRFDYQKDWSLCKLLELHKNLSDYVMIFDWHEDLVIMDSESNPAKLEFYQIKGKKSGNWSITNLLKSETAKDGTLLLSILGKLYDCKAKYNLETTSLNFVSNGRFNVGLEDKTSSLAKDDICILELSQKDKNQIKEKIKLEHKLSSDPVLESITFLKVIDLSLDDSATHTKGKIGDFLNDSYPDQKFNTSSVYRMLFDEVKRRSTYSKSIISYDELLSNKSICKSQFEKIISATGISKDYQQLWTTINAELQSDDVNFDIRRTLNQSWKKLEIERMQPNNSYLFKLIDSIKLIISEEDAKETFIDLSLNVRTNKLLDTIKEKKLIQLSYDDYFIKAIILSETYD